MNIKFLKFQYLKGFKGGPSSTIPDHIYLSLAFLFSAII